MPQCVPHLVQLLVPIPSDGPHSSAGELRGRTLLIAGQGSLTPPGTICATPCEAPIDVEDGLAVEVPLVYYFGHVSPSENDVSGELMPSFQVDQQSQAQDAHFLTPDACSVVATGAVQADTLTASRRHCTDRVSRTWVA